MKECPGFTYRGTDTCDTSDHCVLGFGAVVGCADFSSLARPSRLAMILVSPSCCDNPALIETGDAESLTLSSCLSKITMLQNSLIFRRSHVRLTLVVVLEGHVS